MGAYEVIGGFITNTTALGNATASPGDAFAIRSHDFNSPAWLEQIVADYATAGELRILSPRLHDQVNGIRLRVTATDAAPLVSDRFMQRVFPQDTLDVELQSGGADSSAIALGIYYSSLPGIEARLATWEEIAPRIEDYIGVSQTFNSSGTIGTWAGEVINTDVDQFQVNRDYAILGYETAAAVTAVAFRGSDTGNLRVGGPGSIDRQETRDYFIRQSIARASGRIPVFNSANRGSLTTEVIDNAASTGANPNPILALLSQ